MRWVLFISLSWGLLASADKPEILHFPSLETLDELRPELFRPADLAKYIPLLEDAVLRKHSHSINMAWASFLIRVLRDSDPHVVPINQAVEALKRLDRLDPYVVNKFAEAIMFSSGKPAWVRQAMIRVFGHCAIKTKDPSHYVQWLEYIWNAIEGSHPSVLIALNTVLSYDRRNAQALELRERIVEYARLHAQQQRCGESIADNFLSDEPPKLRVFR